MSRASLKEKEKDKRYKEKSWGKNESWKIADLKQQDKKQVKKKAVLSEGKTIKFSNALLGQL